MKRILVTAVLTCAALFFATTDTAEAQGYYNGNRGVCGTFGVLGSPYALSRVPDPPYFALHPPVYYSAPVPRTYGYSPFAYPGSVRTPDVQMEPAPKQVVNPHVDPAKLDSKKKKTPLNLTQQKPAPKMIHNPFVDQQLALAD